MVMKKLILLLLIPCSLFGQMKKEFFKYGQDGNYAIYSPPDSIKTYDVILYLHGLGERGNTVADFASIENNEIPKLFKQGKIKPFIFIAPQLGALKKAWGKNELIAMFNILDTYKARGYDLHVTGLSLGGMGTYAAIQFAYEYNNNKPGYFKTAGSVCGRTSSTDTIRFSQTAIKIWHGSNDQTVPASPDRSLFKLLLANRYDIEYKEYEGLGHNIWGLAYNESADGYWQWFERKRRKQYHYLDEINFIYYDMEDGLHFKSDSSDYIIPNSYIH